MWLINTRKNSWGGILQEQNRARGQLSFRYLFSKRGDVRKNRGKLNSERRRKQHEALRTELSVLVEDEAEIVHEDQLEPSGEADKRQKQEDTAGRP